MLEREREVRLLRQERDMISDRLALDRQNYDSIIGIRAIGDLLSEFSGDNDTFVRWRTQAEFLRRTYGLDEDATKVLLTMKGKALSWFHSKAEHIQLSIRDLFDEME